MKIKSLLLIVVASVLFVSCSSSGWSCKKRYCNTQPSKTVIEQNDFNCIAAMEDFSENKELTCQ